MSAFDALSPSEWKCLAHAERAWLANGRSPVPGRELPGIVLHGQDLLLKGYLVKHGEGTMMGAGWELTDAGRERLQEAMDELAAHDALRLLNAAPEPAQDRAGGVVRPYASARAATPGELVHRIDFAVPTTGTIGNRFAKWSDAVAAAQRTITGHRYPGQQAKPGDDPGRWSMDEGVLVIYTRAFVHLRLTTTATDSVLRTYEVYRDGKVRALS